MPNRAVAETSGEPRRSGVRLRPPSGQRQNSARIASLGDGSGTGSGAVGVV